MSNENKTVAQLRAEISGHPRVAAGDMPLPGLSKLRKAQLIELLDKLQMPTEAETLAFEVAEEEQAANAVLAGAIYAVSQDTPLTVAERQELNEGKYRGRYEGKTVTARLGKAGTGKFIGTVVDRVHRASDPLNRGDGSGLLLLAIRHISKPRVTLHRAEDVALVS